MTEPATTPPSAAPTLTWRALYVHCHSGKAATDQLITQTVAPVARHLRSEGLIDKWFFLRYWQGSPHVRVRLASMDPSRLDQAVAIMHDALEKASAAFEEPANTLNPHDWYAQFAVSDADAADYGWCDHGEVHEAVYEPEHDRYGGVAAIGLSESLFEVSSEVAAVVIARTSTDQSRTGVALDLLLGFMSSLYDQRSQSIRWLREYAIMWRYLDQVVGRQSSKLQAAAEQTFTASGPELIQRSIRLNEKAPGAYQSWWKSVRATGQKLHELNEEDTLTAWPDAIMVSQLHMLSNRLGLTASDEVYLAWLASLILASPGHDVDYFGDGIDAPDRLYHELSKFRSSIFEGQRPRSRGPIVRSREFASDDPRPLPAPERGALKLTLGDAIAGRRSGRDGFEGEVDQQQLSTLLAFGAGVVDTEPYQIGTETIVRNVRSAPSAGMTYPLIVRAMAFNVNDLRPALYEYLPEEHQLQQMGGLAGIDDVRASSPFFIGDEPRIDITNLPLLLFIGADLGQYRIQYGLRAHRFAMLEIGHVAQTLLLVAQSLSLQSVPVGGFFDDAMCELAQLDSYDEILGYVIPIGSQPGK